MKCRTECGACCIAPSINTPYFGMPDGKAAAVACVHLNLTTNCCLIWGTKRYPEACKNFAPSPESCGSNRAEAIRILTVLESKTCPTLSKPDEKKAICNHRSYYTCTL